MKHRTSKIMRLHRKTAQENKEKFLNEKFIVFVNNKKDNSYKARDENYNITLIKSDINILGKTIYITINKIGPHYMVSD